MTAKKIEKILSQVFLRDYEMSYALYEHELVEVLEELTWSMKTDKDDYIFTLTENRGHVAMLLIEKSGFFQNCRGASLHLVCVDAKD